MKKGELHVWKFTVTQTKTGFNASGKHGNTDVVWRTGGYNTFDILKREVRKKFPGCLFIKKFKTT